MQTPNPNDQISKAFGIYLGFGNWDYGFKLLQLSNKLANQASPANLDDQLYPLN